jgi:hypothetical protein
MWKEGSGSASKWKDGSLAGSSWSIGGSKSGKKWEVGRIRIRIRIKLNGRIQIRIRIRAEGRIRIKVKGRIRHQTEIRIRIRIKVMRIRNNARNWAGTCKFALLSTSVLFFVKTTILLWPSVRFGYFRQFLRQRDCTTFSAMSDYYSLRIRVTEP